MSTAFNVWAPQGNVLPNSGGSVWSNPNVIYDTNPVILTGNTRVFKMWCEGTKTGNVQTINYFESVDGLTSWTAYSGNPIVSNYDPKVFKVSGTYYLYVGNGPISVYTSTDGVTFTLANSTALVQGTSGQWDATQIYQLALADEIAGTWYAYYGGNNGTGPTGDKMG